MKKSIIALCTVVFVLISCNQKKMQNEPLQQIMAHDTTITHDDSKKKNQYEKLYACPMHPEVQGKRNDKCSKCGMKLTVEVK